MHSSISPNPHLSLCCLLISEASSRRLGWLVDSEMRRCRGGLLDWALVMGWGCRCRRALPRAWRGSRWCPEPTRDCGAAPEGSAEAAGTKWRPAAVSCSNKRRAYREKHSPPPGILIVSQKERGIIHLFDWMTGHENNNPTAIFSLWPFYVLSRPPHAGSLRLWSKAHHLFVP